MDKSLSLKTISAAFWSVIQSWFVKFFSLFVFFILAWFLNPTEFGVAAVVVLVLSFVTIFIEFGFPDSIIQRKVLLKGDVDLPFLYSFMITFIVVGVMLFFPGKVVNLLRVEGVEKYIQIAAIIPVFIFLNSFQRAFYYRNLNLKRIAKITVMATFFSGFVAIFLAVNDFGILSIVIQLILFHCIVTGFLWLRPVWKPKIKFSINQSTVLFSYSFFIFLSRLINFFSLRVIDFIILTKFGLAALGLFTVSSKLYLTILELLLSSIFPVLLSSFSKIQDDSERLKRVYLRVLYMMACIVMPFFVLLVLCSPYLEILLFDEQWKGISELMQLLFILGSVLVLQYLNGSLIGAVGRAKTLLVINLLKLISAILILTLVNVRSVDELVAYFVISQLIITPISFYVTMKLMEITLKEMFLVLIPGVVASVISFSIVVIWSQGEGIYSEGVFGFVNLLVTVVIFIFFYMVSLFLLSGSKFKLELQYFINLIFKKNRE